MTFDALGRNGWGRGRLLAVAVCLVLGLTTVASLPGCGGCRPKTAAQRKTELAEKKKKEAAKKKKDDEKKREEEERKKKEKLPDFQVWKGGMMTRPCDGRSLGVHYKPGHWTATAMTTRVNHFDFLGTLEMRCVHGKNDARLSALPLSGTPFYVTTSRQVALSKGKWKTLESIMFAPSCEEKVKYAGQLRYRKGGRTSCNPWDPTFKMPSYQYHFIVLARWPSRYLYLEGLDSIQARSGDTLANSPNAKYYRVSLVKGVKRAMLPSHSQSWTSTAYVLWDDAEPGCLNLDQQQAMIDWLHWGGQLILSGPDTLDRLKGSFLEPYLPATAAVGGRKIDAEDFEPFREWSENGKTNGASRKKMVLAKPWTGINLQKHPQAQFIPNTGELVVERRVGMGRVVATAFRLDSSALKIIPGGDEFFNAILLRRPARKFLVREYAATIVNDPKDVPLEDEVEVGWHKAGDRLDARHISQVRYFSRDTGVPFSTYGRDTRSGNGSDLDQSPASPGLAAWNDFNSVANDARHALKAAAEIEIPKPDFVIWVVVGYLVVLVPVNWLVFRAINRVEWAWVAAPIIAVGCTVVVIKLAQLDIGFARSRTEVAVVELQGGCDRAHVTRYTALYTSLATRYNFELEDPGAAVLPFPRVDSKAAFQMERWTKYRGLVLRRGENVRLERFPVKSNDTNFVHSEHMLDLDGPLALTRDANGKLQVTNGTQFYIREASVVHRDTSGKMQVGWLGTLEPGESKPVDLDPDAGQDLLGEKRRGSALTGRNPSPGEMSLGPLVESAEKKKANLRPGEVRLVGTIAEEIPGLKVSPAASQTRRATLVVAHLGFRQGNDLEELWFGEVPQPDINTLAHPEKIISRDRIRY